MATKKKVTSASRPAAKPAARQLNGHVPEGRSTGTVAVVAGVVVRDGRAAGRSGRLATW